MRSSDHLGIGGIGIVFVIFILFSSATFANAAPPSETPPQNSQQKIDEILDQLAEIKTELSEIREDTEKLQSGLSYVNDTANTIRGTVKTAFEIEIVPGDIQGPEADLPIQYGIIGKCILPEDDGPCSFFEVDKIVAPPFPQIFVTLCVDTFACSILGDHGVELTVDQRVGIALGVHYTGKVGFNLPIPLAPIIPTNILKVSNVGQISAKESVMVGVIPPGPAAIDLNIDPTLRILGERPLDMEMTAWYLSPLSGLSCFNEDGPVECPSLPFSDECYEVDLIPSIDLQQYLDIITDDNLDNVDVGPPIQFKTIGICADGTFDPPLESLDLDFSSIPGRGGKICDLSGSGICTPFTIDFTEPELDIDLGDLAGIDADTTFLKNCVTEGNSCELMTRTNQINIKSNRLTDGIHDMCHWLLGDSGGLCHQIEGL